MLLEDLIVILKVAEFRSITKAATHLDMRTATASAAVKRVEASLGSELFVRTTRQLRLSIAGERYLPQCEQALLMLEQAKQNMREDEGIIDGEIRIALSSDLGRNLVTPWIDDFMEQHPKVTLRSHMSDSNVDFYRDGVDMALRYGSPTDSNAYGFKICNVPRLLFASPQYLQTHPEPQTPQQLLDHNCLFYQLNDIRQDEWHFQHPGGEQKIKLKGNRSANDGELVKRWCIAGKGIAIKSCLDMAEEILAGRAVRVMPQYTPVMSELWLICPSRQSITPIVRQLRDIFRKQTHQVLSRLVERGVLEKHVLK
ncbi:LysR substrate-binding domain-containing protein [Shewanella intestini]|uniref:LysR family transcriptional regulator n=1 Tax=Shewanella intestini TaxID=2017544 RepID=A0ABS5I5V0_9GAMM|nr:MULTISPECIES: LysR family transcriptional regulator [Shewanella]MBR9729371.1 LysR family transcriptional regulator [Shewanella intestini]MRG37450.1 LysR family transcriptional regulator [Shewanella sp. XMDDZSB0408]